MLRVEDLDTPRKREGAEEEMLADLAWLGIRFTEGPFRQSERFDLYERAIALLVARGETYLCDCSRAEIARVASAPHEGEELPYPGTCRSFGMGDRAFKRAPAVRLRMEDGSDFVLRRGDGVFSYQLACTADDVDMSITEVVRGIDLASSAPRQRRIAELLGDPRARERTFVHVPLVVSSDGSRLSKRDGSLTIRSIRERGVPPRQLVRAIAIAYGFDVGATDPLDDLAHALDERPLAEESIRVTDVLRELEAP